MKITVFNNLENIIIFQSDSVSANDFVQFVEKIAEENFDGNLDLGSISESINYIERYCANLTVTINE